jgi:hypothetical protein
LSCERFDKLIYLFLDGRLDKYQEKELKEHLSQCEECTRKLALLESIEGKAKEIEIKEPPQEYWDSFSARVREKIVTREERSTTYRWKRALEGIFSLSPLKVKIAAGVISVVLVFIIGKLYVDYRGEKIFPSRKAVQTEEQPQIEIREMPKEVGLPSEEDREKVESIYEKPKIEREPVTPERDVGKAKDIENLEGKKKISPQVGEPPAQPKIVEEKTTPAYSPVLTDEVTPEAEEPSVETITSPETQAVGAGAEKSVSDTQSRKVHVQEETVGDIEEFRAKGETEKQKDIGLPAPTTGFRTFAAMEQYTLSGMKIPKLAEEDTLMQEDELRRIIKTWETNIKENPADTLNRQGYLQVAVGYYLLGKIAQDTTDISEGSKIIENYLDQIKDPDLERNLSDMLRKLKALR